MSKIKFYRGLKAAYSTTTHVDGLYFCSDTHEILVNDQSYGGEDLGLAANKVVKSIANNADDSTIIDITYTDSTTGSITLPASTYVSNIEDKTLEMPSTVGGIESGTTVEDLEGKTNAEMWDDLLFPTVYPTYVAPSASISLASYSTPQKAGADAPTESNFNTSFSRGSIKVNGVTQDYRSGTLDTDASFIYVNSDASNTTLPTTVALGNTTYNFRAYYLEGPQPYTNKGVAYSSPLAAGYVNSSAVTVNGTYPWFATTVDAETLTEQSLISWNTTVGNMVAGGTTGFTLQPTGSGYQQFKLPRAMTQFQMKNTVSGLFEVVSTSDWSTSTVEEDINGITVTYYLYTYTGSARSSVELIVNF